MNDDFSSTNHSTLTSVPPFGVGDASYQAAGGLEGITRLVNTFYDIMDSSPDAAALRVMHARDLTDSRKKLVYFLSGWMGGPKLYSENYGSISLPVAHSHLPVDEATERAWLNCMEQALLACNYPADFREYMINKLATPAKSIRLMAEFNRSKPQHPAGVAHPAD